MILNRKFQQVFFLIYLTSQKNQATIYHHTTSFSYFDLHLPTSVIKGHEYSTAIPFPFFHRSKPGSRSSDYNISTSNSISRRRKSEIWVSTILSDVEHLRKRAQHLFSSTVKSPPIFNVERNLSNSTRLDKITMKSQRNAPLAWIEDAPASGAFSDGSLARCLSYPCRALVHVSGCCSKLSRIRLFFLKWII